MQPVLQRLAIQAANDQAGVHQLYLQQARHGLNISVDSGNALFLSLHNCEHHRRKTKFCHYGTFYDPLPDVDFDGEALTYQLHRQAEGSTPAETRPLLVHANGDHSRMIGVWQRAANASVRWRNTPPEVIRQHQVMLLDADASAGGSCSLSSLGELSDRMAAGTSMRSSAA